MLSLPVVRPARYQANTACPHYAESDRPTCRRLTDRVGRFVLATGPLCSLHCPTADEPTMLRRVARLAFEPHFLAKTWAKETTPPVYHVPAIWPAIRAALTQLRERPDVLAVYLTGSAIVMGKTDPKDVDVAIVVRDLAAFTGDVARHDLMPKEIDGRRMDYFVWSQPSHPFFPALDPDGARLIAPTHRPRPYRVASGVTTHTPTVEPTLGTIYAEIAAEALAYPQQGQTPPAAPACAVRPEATGWAAVHAIADKPGVTLDDVDAALGRLTAGFPQRQQQLAAYKAAHPIDLANLEAWLHDLHNVANGRAGKSPLSIEQARCERQVGGPVDLVYLWVDGSDPKWQASYRKYVRGTPSASRFTDAGELRASLESARRFAPWIRRTYLVTAGQRPAWLGEFPGVRVVDHRQLIPAKYLPTFNSHAIEPWLHRVPDLAERFLYANDDTLFLRPVTPGQFFAADGKMLMPFSGNAKGGTGMYAKSCTRTAELLDGLFGPRPWRRGWHHIKPYRRSMLAEVARRLPEAMAANAGHKTRHADDYACNGVLWPGYALAAGYAVASPRGAITGGYVNAGDDAADTQLAALLAKPPHLLCVNNGTSATVERVRAWLSLLPASAPKDYEEIK